MSTLIDDLDTLAVHHQERATATDEPGFSKWIHADIAQRCRDHARRLREEMSYHQRGGTTFRVVLAALERINGGPGDVSR